MLSITSLSVSFNEESLPNVFFLAAGLCTSQFCLKQLIYQAKWTKYQCKLVFYETSWRVSAFLKIFSLTCLVNCDFWFFALQALHQLLKDSAEGVTILAYYNKFGTLNDEYRNLLSARIIYGETVHNFDKRFVLFFRFSMVDAYEGCILIFFFDTLCYRLNKIRYQEITDEIIELFPTEIPVSSEIHVQYF